MQGKGGTGELDQKVTQPLLHTSYEGRVCKQREF